MKNHTFHITGIHCKSCKILIEDIITEDVGTESTVHLHEKTVTITCDDERDEREILSLISEKLLPHGYGASLTEQKTEKTVGVLWKAIPLGLIMLLLFIGLQKTGILNFGIGWSVTPTSSFVIGLVASVSSCLAIVWGLVLSLSATVSQDERDDKKNFTLFHLGRIGSFALLGWLLWMLGQAVNIHPILPALLGLGAALIMILLGLNLIGVLAQMNMTLPTGIFQTLRKIEHKTLTPLIIGAATFFLPCGFTQSMQIAALSSGSFFGGFGIMLAFVLWTFPVLALLSFGISGFSWSRYAPLFFRTAGIVVVWLWLLSLLTGMAALGIIPPVITF